MTLFGTAARRLERCEPRRLRVAIGWAVALVLLGLITHGHYAGSGDAVHYMMIAHSIAFDHDLDMADDYADASNIVTGGRDIAGAHVRPGRDGVMRPVHDVGMPLLWVPCYASAYLVADHLTSSIPEAWRRRARLDRFIVLRQLLSASMIVATAWLATVFFELALAASGHKLAALTTTLLWSLSPPILTHGYVFFTEVPTALAATLTVSWLAAARPATWPRVALAGLLTGLLLLIHVRNAGLVVSLALLAALRLWPDRARLLAFGAPLATLLLVRSALTWQLWGRLLTTPHASWSAWPGWSPFLHELASRGLALAFDQEHGLLAVAPLYLLAPIGWLALRRRAPRLAWELLLLVGVYLVTVLAPVVNPHGWRGGWSPAARFLVPIAPFLALPIVLVLAARRLRLLAGIVIGLQCGLDALFWSRPMLTWSEASGSAPFLVALGGDSLVRLLPSWQRSADEALVLAGLALLAWILLCAWASSRARA